MPTKVPQALSLEQHPKRKFLLLSALLVLVLYWQSFSSPFVYDDLDQVVNNPNLGAWSDFVQRFLLHPVTLTTSFLGYGGTTYRPIFWLSLFLDRAAWGISPGAFHATNVILHFLNGSLLFALLRRLNVRVIFAAATSLLWLSLPIDTEVVAWVSGRAYLLCTLFVLLALLASLAHIRRGTAVSAILCFGFSLCAALSHELGIVVLPLFLLLVFAAKIDWAKPVFVVAGSFLFSLFGVESLRLYVGVKGLSGGFYPKWTALALFKYVAMTLLPINMSLERSTSIAPAQPHSMLLIALACFVGVVAFAILRRRQTPELASGLAWFLICIAPFCLLINYQGVAERFTYLAGIGLVAAIVAACFMPVHPQVRRFLFTGLGVWCLWNVYRTSVRVADWSDPVRLYRASLEATPLSPLVHYNLAFSLRERGDTQEALKEYQNALDINPAYPHGYSSLGDVYLKLDQFDLAQAAYRRALAQNSKDTEVLLNSGAAFQGAGQKTAAELMYLRVLQIDPNSSAAHVNLGVLYQGENRLNDAMHQFATAIDMHSKDIVPYYDLGVICQQAGRPDLAMNMYRKVLELKPDDEDTLRNVGLIQRQAATAR